MLKGVGHHAYDDILEIPIIDNRPSEDLLASQLDAVIQKYPKCNAVLVRRHGVYVWGDSWQQAKTQCESFDYLFESAIRMKQMGIEPSLPPLTGTYRVSEEEEPPATKRARVEENGFRGKAKMDNEDDLQSNTIPILPRDGKIILLDIEGCTTAISYVKETLFPYILKHVLDYERKMPSDQVQTVTAALMEDAKQRGISTGPTSAPADGVVSQMMHRLMENDIKATGLKALQGQMWKAGT
jgi:methylthioribulose 1-phosphate dehydratase/enolase-phosphatase E1